MCEQLEPIVEIAENQDHKKFRTYLCPMCGEYLRKPYMNWVIQNKDKPISTCKYCKTKINWAILLNDKNQKENIYEKNNNTNNNINISYFNWVQ